MDLKIMEHTGEEIKFLLVLLLTDMKCYVCPIEICKSSKHALLEARRRIRNVPKEYLLELGISLL
jgi:hypothetical protein